MLNGVLRVNVSPDKQNMFLQLVHEGIVTQLVCRQVQDKLKLKADKQNKDCTTADLVSCLERLKASS